MDTDAWGAASDPQDKKRKTDAAGKEDVGMPDADQNAGGDQAQQGAPAQAQPGQEQQAADAMGAPEEKYRAFKQLNTKLQNTHHVRDLISSTRATKPC